MVYDSRFRATDEAETAEVAAEVEADPPRPKSSRWLLVRERFASLRPKPAQAPVTSTSSATVKKTEARHWLSAPARTGWFSGVSTEDGKWKVDTGCRPLFFCTAACIYGGMHVQMPFMSPIGTSTTGRRIRIAWRRDILRVVVCGTWSTSWAVCTICTILGGSGRRAGGVGVTGRNRGNAWKVGAEANYGLEP